MSNYEGFSMQISGITRHGKSYWTKKKFIPELVSHKPVIILDYKGEYDTSNGEIAKDSDPRWRGYDNVADFFSYLSSEGLTKEVHAIKTWDDEDYILSLRWLEEEKPPVTLILDEAQFIFDDCDLKEAGKCLKKLVRAGAGYGIDVIFIAQSVMDIHPKYRGQFTRRITFRLGHSSDIDVMRDDNNFEDAEKALHLGKREHLIFGDYPSHLNMDKLK